MSTYGNPEFDPTEIPASELSAELAETVLIDDREFAEFIAGEREDLIKTERNERAQSFKLAHAAVAQWRETFGGKASFHTTYVDRAGLPIERRAVVQPINFPGIGKLTRLVVNDEGPDPADFNVRRNDVLDFILSDCSKAFSWQHTSMTRPNRQLPWGALTSTGPFLEQRSDHIRIVQGKEYATFLPRIGGYRTTLYESIERRMRLDEFTGILGGLGVSTFEPGFEIIPFL